MFFSLAPLRRAEASEWIDSNEPCESDFAVCFQDIERVNRFLGGTRALLAALAPQITALPPRPGPVRLLDVCTGSADIPRALVGASKRGVFGGHKLEIVATDNHPKVLAYARQATPASVYPEITVACADAFALPYENGAFDFALCSMAFHHFAPDDCASVLREMARVARHGVVVNDLRRDRMACALIWGLTRLVRAHYLTVHDAPLSVLRAYTPDEFRQIARHAGLGDCSQVRRAPMYRMVLSADTTHLHAPLFPLDKQDKCPVTVSR